MALALPRPAWRVRAAYASHRSLVLASAPLIVSVVSLIVRAHDIGAKSLWYDETVSLINARMGLPELLSATRSDVHPPLYYLLLRVWLGVRTTQGWLACCQRCSAPARRT